MIQLCPRPDPFRLRLWIGAQKNRLDPTMADFNFQEFDQSDLSVSELAQAVRAMPMMSDVRIVVAHGRLHRLQTVLRRAPARRDWVGAQWSELLHLLESAPEETLLALVEPDADPGSDWDRRFRAVADAQAPTLRALMRQGRVQELDLTRPAPPQMGNWVRKRCRFKGLSVRGDAVNPLVARAGHDLRLLDGELDKLAAFADGAEVTARDVQALVTDYREEPIWELSNSVFRQQRPRAVAVLVQLLDQGLAPIQILATLGTQVRLLAAIKSSSASDQEIAGWMKVHPYAVQVARRNAFRYRADQIRAMVDMLLEADHAMKSQPDAELVLEHLIVRLLMPGSWGSPQPVA